MTNDLPSDHPTLYKYPVLYKYDVKRRVRAWWCVSNDSSFMSKSGIVMDDGRIGSVVSHGWKHATPKNTSKANATTAEEQCVSEVSSLYEKRKKLGWQEVLPPNSDLFFKPMLAKKFDKNIKFPNQKYFAQPKLDGHRLIAQRDSLHTRFGEQYVNCQHIREATLEIFERFPQLEVLDGELYNHEYADDFYQLSSLLRVQKVTQEQLGFIHSKVQFHVYDCVTSNPAEKFEDRHSVIRGIFEQDVSNCLQLVRTIPVGSQNEVERALSHYIDLGYEGVMIRGNGPYESGKRSKHLVKLKLREDEEFTILGFIEGKGNWAGAAKSVLLDLGFGIVGKAGVKANYNFASHLLRHGKDYIGSKVTVEHEGITPDGKLRFGVVTKFHKYSIEENGR